MAKPRLGSLAALLCLSLFYPAAASANAESPYPEDYAVYSTIIDQVYLDLRPRLVVVETHTLEGNATLDNRLLRFTQKLGPLAEEIMRDFDEKNREAHELRNLFKTRYKCAVIGLASDHFLSGFDPWRAFFRKYRNSQGLIRFSRVGFNNNKDQALVYVQESSGRRRCSTGKYYVLSKEGTKWRIGGEALILIS